MYVCMYVCMYLCTDVRSRQHQKVNLRSQMRMQWPIFVKLGMWVVGDTSITHVVCRHGMRIFYTSFAYLFWLADNKKVNIQSSVWATLMKLGMWVLMGISATHVVCRHQMRIFNTSFGYLFWLANNKKKSNIQSSVWATLMKRGTQKTRVNHLTNLNHSGSVHGQNDSNMCEKWVFFVRVLTHYGSNESNDSLGVFSVCG